MAESAVIVGGGLAGIATALQLADDGRVVTLIEGRPRLGGAAFSFQRGQLSIDNGQHVFLRCCSAYRTLLERIGATDQVTLQDHLDIPVLRADGVRARLGRVPGVPAPLHLTTALARYGLLSRTDRIRAVRGALALRRLNPTDLSLDGQSLGTFLRRHGQNDATIGALWGIVATATLNQRPDTASLMLAAKVFRTGLLDRAGAADVGFAHAPLGAVHSIAAMSALQDAGVEVLLRHRVDRVEPGGLVCASTRDGLRRWRADAVVLAVPPAAALAVAPALQDSRAAAVRGLGTTPIVNVHVVYDRQVTDLPFAAAVDSPVQWVFDRTESSGLRRTHRAGQYLAVTVSAADDIITTPSRLLQQQFVTELARLLPGAARANVLDTFVTREPRATFAQTPGSAAMRPGPDPGLDRVWLAGAWTATGWPDTMEGAVRSGVAAAQAVKPPIARRSTNGRPAALGNSRHSATHREGVRR
ncbi:MAG: hydroxysqualene dehydroxylase HpnE [Jatrophihabitantaceae bacterium]